MKFLSLRAYKADLQVIMKFLNIIKKIISIIINNDLSINFIYNFLFKSETFILNIHFYVSFPEFLNLMLFCFLKVNDLLFIGKLYRVISATANLIRER